MKLEAYITNLGKYNEGELIGKWITFPIDEEEREAVLEEIGISEEPNEEGLIYEEYFFTDYENNIFGFGEYESIEHLNDIAEQLEDIDEDEEVISAIIEHCSTVEEALEILSDRGYMIYSGCYDMGDVAQQYVEECGLLHGIPDNIANYFDYDALGRDMSLEGTFIDYSEGYIEIF